MAFGLASADWQTAGFDCIVIVIMGHDAAFGLMPRAGSEYCSGNDS